MTRVLVVEDEEWIRKGIVGSVDWAQLDCEVVGEAENGIRGLEQVEACKPELIITDLKMPQMDGIEMLTRIREAGNTVPVIILTAFDSFSYAQKAIRLGVVDYLVKPFHDGELEAAILSMRKRMPALQETGESRETEPDGMPDRSSISSRHVLAALDYLEQHFAEPDLAMSDVALALNLSESRLGHLFKDETGLSPLTYLTRYRMKKARHLLRDSRVRVYEAADRVGYRDIAYFSNTFKKVTGMTPSEYQNKYR